MGLKLDGICTNQQLDSSGEVLNIAGHDISDFLEDKAVVNWEHEKGSEDIIGHVIYAKKILKESDCENERQKMFWDISGGPYVYIIAELYEDEQHPGAVACAAMVRYYAKRKEKMFIGWSVEGQTLERDGNKLERSVGRRVAFTLRPCNKSAMMGVFEDPKLQSTVAKYESYVPTHKEFEIESTIFEDVSRKSPKKALSELKKAISVLNKTLEAGSYNVAPSQLVGGAALQVEDRSIKNRAKAAIRDWNRIRPLKEVLKAALPEVSDAYIDHFAQLADEMHLRKNIPALQRISSYNSPNAQQDEHQMRLLDGIYYDPAQELNPDHEYSSNKVYKLQNDAGEKVIVKPPTKAVDSIFGPTEGAHNSTLYYKLAKDFFDMGQHVPVTNYFIHPNREARQHQTGSYGDRPWQAMSFIGDAKSAFDSGYEKALNKARSNGTLHKLALMDMITGTGDRHHGNVMYDKNGTVYHIDNDRAFNHDGRYAPHYFSEDQQNGFPGIGYDRVHVDAKQWLDKLDPRKMVSIMLKHGMDRPRIENSVRALKMLQKLTDEGKTFRDMHTEMTKEWD